ncbi:replication restart helicase PriA [Helicobacter mustelae]|uniref:Replication restart protein PriA n=1 Tax=Helicobacter mustelae (strain ATCC 43772 / CCUG 25715 / CIP 103759 / LMG 18044 / NCTC 12198 / R85-136P) TaxID=679897 RepID=D3UJB4_HELM1|nr:primosomal protein N' [Helicobacter mustelae]CBG40589.1 putative primosomal replication factor [Helicobacter mustelae 12198]SQH72086.1 primosomal replication factor [Helicobacter mustelae]
MHYYLTASLKSSAPYLTYASPTPCEAFDIIHIPLRKQTRLGIIICEVEKPEFPCKTLQKSPLHFTPIQKKLGKFIAQYYCASYGESFGILTPLDPTTDDFSDIRDLNSISRAVSGDFVQDCGGFDDTEAQHMPNPPETASQICTNMPPKETPCLSKNKSGLDGATSASTLEDQSQPRLHDLNPRQKLALDFCQKDCLSLLFGDTGSGKTEIFFHLIDEKLKEGKTTLLLMPEISLTPQMERRLKEAFGEIFVLWHSKLGTKKRRENLGKIQSQKAKIIAGARSALFLPLVNLGQIIVDEEHDDAYKSQNKPLYNAKDLCIFLASKDLRIILSSATPCPSSYLIAKNRSRIFRLKGGHFQTKKTFLFDPSTQIPSPMLLEALQKNLEAKKQSMIFIPTRANFKTLLCQTCGESILCEQCSVAMSVHHKKQALLCHYCGFSKSIPQFCPSCGGADFLSQRIGSAQLKLELQNHLPNARIGIFDRDHASTDRQIKSLLKALKKEEIDILIGTQMIAKGHDYPKVSLAVILELDYILKSPDFRCNEKALNLLYQVAGRSGRKSDGCVIIQTLNANFFSEFLQDYEDFLLHELDLRKNLYPPFKKLALLHFQDKEEGKVLQNLGKVLQNLQAHSTQDFQIIGAEKNRIEKIANVYRHHILLRIHHQIPTLRLLQHLQSQYDFSIDIDPLDFS